MSWTSPLDDSDVLALLMEHFPGLLFVKDSDFRILAANERFLSLYPEAQRPHVIGTTTIEDYPKAQREKFLADDRAAFETGATEVVETIDFPNGDRQTLLTRKLAKLGRDGKVYLVGTSTDITEQQRQQQTLERQNEALNEFAYRVSHDLRSPVVSSIALIEIAQTMLNVGNVEETQNILGRVQRALGQAETLASDLLHLTRIENQEPKPATVDVQAVIDASLAHARDVYGDHGVDIQTDIGEIDTVTTESQRFAWIVENLISNAIKYSDPEVDKKWVSLRLRRTKRTVKLTAEDNGLGIPPAQRGRLFQMFQRFHPRNATGAGLGLYMVRRTANRLGGNATYDPTEHGSRFTITVSENPDTWN